MKNTPVLDPRDAKALMNEIAERAKLYTPEWRLDPDDMDAGGALAALFSRMYAQTVDRYNGVLHKDYIEFLNLLAVRQQPVTPSEGIVAVEIAPGTEESVRIGRDTQFYHEAEDGSRVNFLSDETIYATPARITGMICVDPEHDAIALCNMDSEESFELFHVPEDQNLQKHAFTLRHDEVFMLSRPSIVRVQIGQTAQYLAQQAAERLTRSNFAVWEYFSGGIWHAFDEAVADGDCVVLKKNNNLPVEPYAEEDDETSGLCIRCTMKQTEEAALLAVKSLRVDSCYQEGVWMPCDEAYANDVRIDAVYGGYAFSEPMLQYDCFYIASDEVLGKHGAQVEMRMQMHTMVRKSDAEQALYTFKDKFVIDKDVTPPEPAKKYVSRVVWEYWNGVGWTDLSVSGDLNPFGQDAEGEKIITFTLPEDAGKTVVSSVERYWIRARAVYVENAFDLYATQLWPMVRDVQLRCRYAACRGVQSVLTENNLQSLLQISTNGRDLAATLFAPLLDERPSVYLCFDDAPAGYPVPLYLELLGKVRDPRRIQVQAYMERGFEEIKTTNTLEGCTRAGMLSLYLPRGMKQTEVFGLSGWFVRINDVTGRRNLASYPRVGRIIPNCVHVTQRERAADMVFSTDIHEANKRIRLDERPVLQADVWVDEKSRLTESAIRELMEDKENTRAEYDADGALSRLFVRWNQVESLALSGAEERVYQLDEEEGRIDFGDGVHGAIPPAGEENIAVEYSFGGGVKGNIPAGSIDGITTAESGVMRAFNFLPICGGNDAQSISLVEELGPQRLRHRGRAVTAADFEALVMEEFSEVRAVKCFANTDESGARAPGNVTVVVLTASYDSEPHTLALCDRIEKYLKDRCDGRLARSGLHVIPAQVMTVGVTARIELDHVENAAEAERMALAALRELLNPAAGRNAIGSLPEPAQLYAVLRRVPHVTAVRDVLMEGSYFDYNVSRITPLEAGSRYPFAVTKNGRHVIRI